MLRSKKNSERFLTYQLKVNSVGREYLIDKRYSEFEALHLTMKKINKQYGFKDFPSKRGSKKKKI